MNGGSLSIDEESENGFWLKEDSDEYEQIKYYLSLSTGVIVNNLEVWKIDLPEYSSRFEKRVGSMLRLPSWTLPETLPEGDNLQDVCHRGFRFESSPGMHFATGRITVPDVDVVTLLYCEIAVGRAYVTDSSDIATTKLPKGYDSFYVSPMKLDRDSDGVFSISEYQLAANFNYRSPAEYAHEYFISDALQVCPRYVVRFETTPETGSKQSVEFFDPIMYRPVSIEEKMANSHLSRRVVPLQQMYQQTINDVSVQDAVLTKKMQYINGELEKVDDVLRSININYAEAYENIQAEAQRAIVKLQQLTKQKLESLLCIEMEYRREKEEIEWSEAFIASCAKPAKSRKVEPVDFLKFWKCHALLRNGLCRAAPVEVTVLQDIRPDIVVNGSFNVTCEEILPEVPSLTPKVSTQDESVVEQEDADGSEEDALEARRFGELEHYVSRVNQSGVFGSTAPPSEELVSPPTQTMVDNTQDVISQALENALRNSGSIPLPPSIVRCSAAGKVYPLPSLVRASDGNGETLQELQSNYEHNMKKLIAQAVAPSNIATANVSSKPNIINRSYSEMPSGAMRTPQSKLQPKSRTLLNVKSSPESDVPTTQEKSQTPHRSLFSPDHRIPEEKEGSDEEEHNAIDLLMELTERCRPAFSLHEAGVRRKKQLSTSKFEFSEKLVFMDTCILQPQEQQDLYMSLPFYSKLPDCKLLYATWKDTRGLSFLYRAVGQASDPMVVIIQSGDFRFGAYVSQGISNSSKWIGSPSCFLFSTSLDLKLTYNGKNPPVKVKTNQVSFGCFGDSEHLEFGNGDLYIESDLLTGHSEVEGCYGVGFDRDDTLVTGLLAGRSPFGIDQLEHYCRFSCTHIIKKPPKCLENILRLISSISNG